MSRRWDVGSLQHLELDREAGTARWADWRPGNEGELTQPLEAFVAHGAPVDVVLPRGVALEVLAYLGLDRTPWCDPGATLTLAVGEATLTLWAWPPPTAHDERLASLVARATLSPAEWFARAGLATGVLAADAVVSGVPVARDTLVMLHPNGALHFGTVASDVEVRGIPVRRGQRVTLAADGAVTFVTS